MKNFIEAAQYAFAALGGALGAVMGRTTGSLTASSWRGNTSPSSAKRNSSGCRS